MRYTRIAALSGACALLAGALVACAPPTVQMTRAGISKITTTGFRVMLDLNVANPNQYALPISQVSWNLNLFGAEVTRGATPQRTSIAPGGRSVVQVPIGVRYETVGNLYQKLISQRSIPYSIAGQVDFRTPAGPFYVRFGDSGSWRNPIMMGVTSTDSEVTASVDVDVLDATR